MRITKWISLAVAIVAILAGYRSLTEGADLPEPHSADSAPTPSPSAPPSAAVASQIRRINGNPQQYRRALALLSTLPVKGRAPKTGYSREQFGQEWSDAAGNFEWTRNGCDTRNDVLARDLAPSGNVTFKPGTHRCKVLAGTLLYERYTGAINYRFDSTDDEYATDLDIEHVVPLAWVWQHGAQLWPEEHRAAFANAPDVLFAGDPSQNRQHVDAGPAAWLPANKAYRCAYVTTWVHVLNRWGLWVNPADQQAMERILLRCVDA